MVGEGRLRGEGERADNRRKGDCVASVPQGPTTVGTVALPDKQTQTNVQIGPDRPPGRG